MKNSDGAWRSNGVVLPEGTRLRLKYKGQCHRGVIRDGVWVLKKGTFVSPSAAANAVAAVGKTRFNGWLYWEAMLPESSKWKLLRDLRWGA